MMARTIPMILLGLSASTGCLAFSAAPFDSQCDRARCERSVSAAVASAADVKDIPAVDPAHYPNSVGYLYQGSLANIFWLQNEPRAGQIADLVASIRALVGRGVAGEILSATMQAVDPLPDAQPTVSQMSRAAVQSVRQMAQYAFVTSDYADSLGSALGAYNTDPARHQALDDTAARVDAELRASATPSAPGTLPAPPPPVNQRLLRPGKYFADAVKDQARTRVTTRASVMQQAIDTRNATAYADAFTDVFLAQSDIDLAKIALDALAVHHIEGQLRGQPLDAVIAKYVTALPAPDRPLAVEQLALINQLNLIAGDTTTPRQPLVAALLLVDEDHRQGEQDATLSCPLIWQHVTDTAWLVSQLVRIKADGTTEAQVNALIAAIVASI
jgi:hypothetical protein